MLFLKFGTRVVDFSSVGVNLGASATFDDDQDNSCTPVIWSPRSFPSVPNRILFFFETNPHRKRWARSRKYSAPTWGRGSSTSRVHTSRGPPESHFPVTKVAKREAFEPSTHPGRRTFDYFVPAPKVRTIFETLGLQWDEILSSTTKDAFASSDNDRLWTYYDKGCAGSSGRGAFDKDLSQKKILCFG